MAGVIQWLDDLEAAKAAAREKNRLILLDFFNPG